MQICVDGRMVPSEEGKTGASVYTFKMSGVQIPKDSGDWIQPDDNIVNARKRSAGGGYNSGAKLQI